MASAVGVVGVAAAPCSAALSSKRSELVGRTRAFQVSGAVGVPSLPVRGLKVTASGGKKITTKEPYGPSGGTKWKDGVDASGRKGKGKGIYQFAKKYGANVDGYSPIYAEDEWTAQGNNYGRAGLLLWALTFAGLIVGGALLVYTTSALS